MTASQSSGWECGRMTRQAPLTQAVVVINRGFLRANFAARADKEAKRRRASLASFARKRHSSGARHVQTWAEFQVVAVGRRERRDFVEPGLPTKNEGLWKVVVLAERCPRCAKHPRCGGRFGRAEQRQDFPPPPKALTQKRAKLRIEADRPSSASHSTCEETVMDNLSHVERKLRTAAMRRRRRRSPCRRG
jgi:hypothetical protein